MYIKDFKGKAIFALASAFYDSQKDLGYPGFSIKVEETYSYVENDHNPHIKVIVNDEGILYEIYDYEESSIKMSYYEYNENDDHEKIINNIYKDFSNLLNNNMWIFKLSFDKLIGTPKEYLELKEIIENIKVNNAKEELSEVIRHVKFLKYTESLPLELCEDLEKDLEEI